MKNGINKLLYEKRIELGWKEKEAAKRLKITKAELHLIERGYVTIREKLKARFIDIYQLSPDFFEDDYRYPAEVFGEQKESKFFTKLDELLNNWKIRIGCWVLTLGFAAMAISGACLNYNVNTNTPTFFHEEVNRMDELTKEKGKYTLVDIHDSAMMQMLLDSYWSYGNSKDESRTMDVSVNFFTLPQHIQYTFFKGSKPVEYEGADYTVRFESRVYINGTFRNKIKILKSETGIDDKIFYATADTNYQGEVSIWEIQLLNDKGILTRINGDDPRWQQSIDFINTNLETFTKELINFFNTDTEIVKITTFKNFLIDLTTGVGDVVFWSSTSGILTVIGAAFSILFFSLCFVYLFKKSKVAEVNADIEEMSFEDTPENERKKKRRLLPNWKLFPVLPETLIRVGSILLLSAGSIGIYFILQALLQLDVKSLKSIYDTNSIVNSLTIIGIICIFFMKLDIYQNKKSVFLVNYSLFFLGLGYYILLILVKGRLCENQGLFSSLAILLLDFIPGNSVWGILAFNLLIMFLFYEPKKYENDNHKMRVYRLLSLLPLAYLVVSGILSTGKSNFGWEIPFEVYSLFFSKSTILVVFAIAFVFAIYFYKKFIYKRFKKDEADNYVRGNKYFFTKNLIAVAIIGILGLVSLILHYTAPDNPFGNDHYILLCLPFILLYHQHLGKRIAWFDDTMAVLYGLSLCLGIVLIAFSSLNFLIMA